ncbi:hypothetical protein EDB85DRAFT_1890079 [Lactarius pseudohatsudake]|nr:hypothetical protein EDB85DRAFT_1890079 [Lactarius pseudohatsudake]
MRRGVFEWSRDKRKNTERIVRGGVVDVFPSDHVAEEHRRQRFIPVFPRRCQRYHRESRLSAAHARREQLAALSKKKPAHLTRLRVLIRLPLLTFGKPTVTFCTALALPREGGEDRRRSAKGDGGASANAYVFSCGTKYPRMCRGPRGMEINGHAPILESTNTSRLSFASQLRISSTSWLRPRPGRMHQLLAVREAGICARTSSSRLRAEGRKAETGWNGSATRLVNKMDRYGRRTH